MAITVPTLVPFALFSASENVAAFTTGGWLPPPPPPVTVIDTVASALDRVPSLAENVKLSGPV